MLSKVLSGSFLGVNGYIVNVEVDISNGLPSFNIVGMGDTAISESKERVRAAIKNTSYKMPSKRIIVNLSPAGIKKEGAFFDLAIAVGILVNLGEIKEEKLKDYILIGELSLSGDIKKTNGIINAAITAKENNLKGIIIPFDNYIEASVIEGIEVIALKNLKEIVRFFNDDIYPSDYPEHKFNTIDIEENFKDVKGQEKAKRALEIAAAGGHNLFMSGSPGAGKSMLAKRFSGILPNMTQEEIIESTKIYSISGLLNDENPIIRNRPFRSPHHTSSDVSIIGGGNFPKPGEISLSHNGVLFLDEIPEFSKKVLEVLRQPLEDKKVTVSRAKQSSIFPANFILLGAANPCPCGYLYEDDGINTCVCSQTQINNYQKKLSGPILDRIDIYIEIKRLSEEELLNYPEGENTEVIKRRVEIAREVQRKRYNSSKTNSNMTSSDIKRYCKLDEESKNIFKIAIKNLGLSARGFDKILKLSRTIADLEKSKEIKKNHLIEAISYRKN